MTQQQPPVMYQPVYSPQSIVVPARSGLATASLVLGILGLLTMPLTALFFGIFGVIWSAIPVALGHVALREIKRTGQLGSGVAVVGLVLGYSQAAYYLATSAVAVLAAWGL